MKNIVMFVGLCLSCIMTWAQSKNTSTEVIDYREAGGKIILSLAVNGVMADFVLDLAGHNALLPEHLERLKIDTTVRGDFRYNKFQYKQVPVASSVKINTISLGNSVFGNEVAAFVLKDEPFLRELGVVGVVGSSLFSNTTLTIDARRKKITISTPYKPSYMKLDHRVDMELITANGIVCPVLLDGKEVSLLVDTWNDGEVMLSPKDFAGLNAKSGDAVKVSMGYGKTEISAPSKEIENVSFVKEELGQMSVSENSSLSRSVLGNGMLKRGLLSIDYARRKVYFQPFDLVEIKDETESIPEVRIEAGRLNAITRGYFLEHIFDYRTGKDFELKGDKPVVIDFWATWCGPCMRLLPEMEKLAEKYKDEVLFLKVNADQEKELCSMFNVTALPTLFFIPVGGKPIVEVGATPEKFEEIITNQLLKK
ncbi:thioredoxin domain-containing protein [Butyricimonas paravirosa]